MAWHGCDGRRWHGHPHVVGASINAVRMQANALSQLVRQLRDGQTRQDKVHDDDDADVHHWGTSAAQIEMGMPSFHK